MRDNNNNNTAATSTVSMISAVQEEWIRLNKEMSGKLATFTPIIDGLLDSFKSQPELFDSSKVFARFWHTNFQTWFFCKLTNKQNKKGNQFLVHEEHAYRRVSAQHPSLGQHEAGRQVDSVQRLRAPSCRTTLRKNNSQHTHTCVHVIYS